MSSRDARGLPVVHTTLTQDPVVTGRAAVPYVGTRRTVTMTTMADIADRIPEVVGWVLENGHAPAGAPFLRYLVIDMERELVVEAGIPVDGPVEAAGEVYAGTLPAGRYATVVHTGHPDDLVGATGDLLRWAEREGLAFDASPGPDGEVWGCRLENYLTDPREEPDMDRWETELAFRLAD
ncbi:GyrI-like domain-containing protein [Kineococcus sp. SYSU DK003]|uniref:GyrI-like domain-containing protein n=1 Tax=Kineococcus sp. SYSU DK003 TaxID=3383124 RepID=UPI003D7D8EEA